MTDAVLDKLKTSCANCTITSSTIDEQYFAACDPENPTYLTYRARLEGTSEIDSNSLISLIEEWARGKPSIIIGGVEMTVDFNCPVAIPQHATNTERCKPQTKASRNSRSNTDDYGAAIGGTVAVILIAALTVVTISTVRLRIALHHREVSTDPIQRAEE